MKSTLANPVEMVKMGAPRIIQNDAELHEYTEALFALTAKPRPTKAELNTIDLLTLLIQTYENKGRTVPRVSPVEVLRYLMDKHGMEQKDLKPILGSDALVSLILNGKRNLTIPHIHALAKSFHVPASVFLGNEDERKVA